MHNLVSKSTSLGRKLAAASFPFCDAAQADENLSSTDWELIARERSIEWDQVQVVRLLGAGTRSEVYECVVYGVRVAAKQALEVLEDLDHADSIDDSCTRPTTEGRFAAGGSMSMSGNASTTNMRLQTLGSKRRNILQRFAEWHAAQSLSLSLSSSSPSSSSSSSSSSSWDERRRLSARAPGITDMRVRGSSNQSAQDRRTMTMRHEQQQVLGRPAACHPHILPVLGLCEEADGGVLFMELAVGGSLLDVVSSGLLTRVAACVQLACLLDQCLSQATAFLS